MANPRVKHEEAQGAGPWAVLLEGTANLVLREVVFNDVVLVARRDEAAAHGGLELSLIHI